MEVGIIESFVTFLVVILIIAFTLMPLLSFFFAIGSLIAENKKWLVIWILVFFISGTTDVYFTSNRIDPVIKVHFWFMDRQFVKEQKAREKAYLEEEKTNKIHLRISK